MRQALYRKYRSRQLSDVIGQDHITKTLQQAIANGRISHAYLFTGPRGVGKTSIARILAHAINGLSYNDEKAYIDIIEIDGASNGRVDEIRELRDKVYIIDEVHMISTSAFNALLKTLEEPPEHVVFILATTEAHKLPATVVSRTQHFAFKPIEPAVAAKHLKYIAKKEHIDINDEALALIAEHGQGSFRDSISLLDQAANFSPPITAETISNLLGIPPKQQLDNLLTDLTDADRPAVIKDLSRMYDQGYPPAMIASQLSSRLRAYLIDDTTLIPTTTLLALLADLINVPAQNDPSNALLLTLLRSLPAQTLLTKDKPKPQPTPEKPLPPQPIEAKKPKPAAKRPATDTSPADQPGESPVTTQAADIILDEQTWGQVLDLLKASYNTLYGIVRMAKLDLDNQGVIRLQFAYKFHQQRINDSKNREIILRSVEQVTSHKYTLECVVDTNLLANKPTASQSKEPDISAIANIFGGGEMLSQD